MAFKLNHQKKSPLQQRLQSSSGGTNPEVEAMNKMLAERALANGIQSSKPDVALNPDSGKEDGFLKKLSFAVQNPMTAAKIAMGLGESGYIPSGAQKGLDAGTLERSEFDDYALDIINLPGALTKVAEGASEGDLKKVGKGLLYSAPYGKTISKVLGGTNKAAKLAYNTSAKYKNIANSVQNKLTPKVLKKPVEKLLGDDGAKLVAKAAIKKSV
tara:strand:- start:230 stop:871 length:642 start_codon:yes stop_codon:yes gene_type:complete